MRILSFFLVAAAFTAIFIGIVTLSALATGAVHAQLSARPEARGGPSFN